MRWAGWADGYTNAIFRLLNHLPGPKKGLIGPWAHKYPHFAKPGPRIGFLQECLRWWDQHLKDIDTGIMDEPQLRAWINSALAPSPAPRRPARSLGGGTRMEWRRDGSSLPSPGGEWADGHAIEEGHHDFLGRELPDGRRAHGAGTGRFPDGPLDQNGEAGLMTIFETDVLDENVDLFGFPQFHAEVASASHQANVAAVLSAVREDGRATLVSYGVLNLTHRGKPFKTRADAVGTAAERHDSTQRLRAARRQGPAASSGAVHGPVASDLAVQREGDTHDRARQRKA